MRLPLAATLGLLLLSSTAEARGHRSHSSTSHARASHSRAHAHGHSSSRAAAPRVVHYRPAVHVAVGDPWSPHYVAPARAGYAWVSGSYYRGRYIPGYWVATAAPAPDMVWVPGYWAGRSYVEGYWRPVQRSGYTWTEGYYDTGGTWIGGAWSPGGGSVSVGTSVGNVGVEIHAPLP